MRQTRGGGPQEKRPRPEEHQEDEEEEEAPLDFFDAYGGLDDELGIDGDFGDDFMMMDDDEGGFLPDGDEYADDHQVEEVDGSDDDEQKGKEKNKNEGETKSDGRRAKKKQRDASASQEREGSGDSHVDVDFSVDSMLESDIPLLAKFLDGYIPDVNRTFDLASFTTAIFNRGVGTSVITACSGGGGGVDDKNDEDGEEEDEEEEEDFYGLLSLLRFPSASATPKPSNKSDEAAQSSSSSSTSSLPKHLERAVDPLPHLSNPGAAHPSALLNSKRGALVVAQLFSQLPPLLIAKLYECFVDEVQQQQPPDFLVFLSSVSIAAADATDKTPLTAKGAGGSSSVKERAQSSPNNKKARVEEEEGEQAGGSDDGGGAAAAAIKYVTFHRFEEELFFRSRDPTTMVAIGKYPAAEPTDPRRCLCFAVSWREFVTVTKELTLLATSAS